MRRVVALVLAVGAALLLGAAPAWAHSQLDASNPADGASVATSPPAVSLTFNEDVQAGFTVITLIGPDGKDYHSGNVTETDQTVTVGALPLGPAGVYQIGYRVVSADGHPVSGKTSFTLTAAGPGSADAQVPAATAAPNAVPSAAPPDAGGRAGVAVDRRCRRARRPRAWCWRCGWAACREHPRRPGHGSAAPRPGGGMPDSPRRDARLAVKDVETRRPESRDSPS